MDDDVEVWRQEVADVTPWHLQVEPVIIPKAQEAVTVHRTPPMPQPLYHHTLAHFDAALAKKLKKAKPDMTLDLHDYSADEAYALLVDKVAQAYHYHKRTMLVITGKGRVTGHGVLRRMVPLWCEQPPLEAMIVGLRQAHRQHGGEGAYYIQIKRKRDES